MFSIKTQILSSIIFYSILIFKNQTIRKSKLIIAVPKTSHKDQHVLLPLISVRSPLPLMEVFTEYKIEQMMISLKDEGLKKHLVISTECYNRNRPHNGVLRFSSNHCTTIFGRKQMNPELRKSNCLKAQKRYN